VSQAGHPVQEDAPEDIVAALLTDLGQLAGFAYKCRRAGVGDDSVARCAFRCVEVSKCARKTLRLSRLLSALFTSLGTLDH
jgi:hypothetical protein